MDNEESFRRVAADSMAQGLILEYLLAEYWIKLSKPERLAAARKLLDASARTDHFSGATKGDEPASEQFADVVTRFQADLDRYVGRALHRCGDTEEGYEGRGN